MTWKPDSAEPPSLVVEHAVAVARRGGRPGGCQKSSRGAAVFGVDTRRIYGSGHNSPVLPDQCTGSDVCRRTCAVRCVHAEQVAVMNARVETAIRGTYEQLQLVHVKVAGPELALVGSGSPSCAQCSRVIAWDGAVAGVWLYQVDFWTGATEHARWKYYTTADFHRMSLAAEEAK